MANEIEFLILIAKNFSRALNHLDPNRDFDKCTYNDDSCILLAILKHKYFKSD